MSNYGFFLWQLWAFYGNHELHVPFPQKIVLLALLPAPLRGTVYHSIVSRRPYMNIAVSVAVSTLDYPPPLGLNNIGG